VKDLQTMHLVDDYAITSAEEVSAAPGEPRTLLLQARGGGLSGAARVLINDLGIDDFTVASDFELLVRLPSTLDNVLLGNMVFVVYGSYATGRRRVRLVHALTRRPRAVEGRQKLIQQVVRVLLSGARSNKFDRAGGGDLAREMTNALADGRDPAVAVAQAVTSTSTYVKVRQRGLRIPAPERLRELAFEGILYEADQAVALVRLRDAAGGNSQVPVVL
jgi:hypothetical protein